jgi:hypothetical protein
MQEGASASCAAIEPTAMLAIGDAKNAGMIDTVICQASRKRLCRRRFRNSRSDRSRREKRRCESLASPESRMRGL